MNQSEMQVLFYSPIPIIIHIIANIIQIQREFVACTGLGNKKKYYGSYDTISTADIS